MDWYGISQNETKSVYFLNTCPQPSGGRLWLGLSLFRMDCLSLTAGAFMRMEIIFVDKTGRANLHGQVTGADKNHKGMLPLPQGRAGNLLLDGGGKHISQAHFKVAFGEKSFRFH